jgi:hypothetical protein
MRQKYARSPDLAIGENPGDLSAVAEQLLRSWPQSHLSIRRRKQSPASSAEARAGIGHEGQSGRCPKGGDRRLGPAPRKADGSDS